MSNNTSANKEKNAAKNDAVTAVEVVKDDTVVYEDGDFEDYNADHDYDVDTDDSSAKDKKSAKEDKSSKNKDADKDQKSSKGDESDSKSKKEDKSDKKDKDSKSDKTDKDSKKDKSEEDDKAGITMAGIYQWASKLKDDFKSDASGMTQDVSEKATAMMLSKLLDAVDLELAAFDKSLEVAKNLVTTAEERRKKIAAKKDKYQGMIDKLDKE